MCMRLEGLRYRESTKAVIIRMDIDSATPDTKKEEAYYNVISLTLLPWHEVPPKWVTFNRLSGFSGRLAEKRFLEIVVESTHWLCRSQCGESSAHRFTGATTTKQPHSWCSGWLTIMQSMRPASAHCIVFGRRVPQWMYTEHHVWDTGRQARTQGLVCVDDGSPEEAIRPAR